jgi:hypothetical protein
MHRLQCEPHLGKEAHLHHLVDVWLVKSHAPPSCKASAHTDGHKLPSWLQKKRGVRRKAVSALTPLSRQDVDAGPCVD